MASSGRKGKKSKGTVVSLQSFLSNDDVPVGTTQVAKNIRNVDGEDSDEEGNMLTVVCQLPTAPRASRMYDDNSIPLKPPFIAYVSNLPFDIKEEDMYEYFSTNNIKSVRLPRDDGDSGRVRGFGYIEFESRDGLVQSLGIRDPIIKGRRIRIELSNENELIGKQRGTKRDYDSNRTNIEGRELSSWRNDKNTINDSYCLGLARNSADQRCTVNENNSRSWRTKSQKTFTTSSSVGQLHLNDQGSNHLDNSTLERPKLILKPRTLPLPKLDVPIHISSKTDINDSSLKSPTKSAESVFGSAKPVDTTARDLEIEQRLADSRQNILSREIVKATNDLSELSFAKDEKSITVNWRRQDEKIKTWNHLDTSSTDTCGEHVKESSKNQHKSGRSGSPKNKEATRKNSVKIKRSVEADRKLGKCVINKQQSILSSNKYSGLNDDSD